MASGCLILAIVQDRTQDKMRCVTYGIKINLKTTKSTDILQVTISGSFNLNLYAIRFATELGL